VALADVFDAMVTRRVYKDSMSLEAAAAELRRVAGTQLDPELVRLFEREEAEIHDVFHQHADETIESASWT
jgi:putative two-component system response regulator